MAPSANPSLGSVSEVVGGSFTGVVVVVGAAGVPNDDKPNFAGGKAVVAFVEAIGAVVVAVAVLASRLPLKLSELLVERPDCVTGAPPVEV